jgi:hypothetical protein
MLDYLVIMRVIVLLLCMVLVVGCASRNASITPIPPRSPFAERIVPIATDARFIGSVSPADLQFVQQALVSQPGCSDAQIDFVSKEETPNGVVMEVRRQYCFYEFRSDAAGHWQLVRHGTWHA